MARDARVIIMDEPTSSLTADEAERLHQVMARLKASGAAVVYVTHFLDHVLPHADRVTIMRDGAVVRTADVKDETKQSLVEAMLGEPADVAFPAVPPAPGPERRALARRRGPVDAVGPQRRQPQGAQRRNRRADRSCRQRPERTRAEPFSAPTRCSPDASHWRARSMKRPRRKSRSARGLVLVPEDRRKQGLVLTQHMRQNVTLPYLDRFSRFGALFEGRERRRATELVAHFDINPRSVDGDVARYSGGNQQKVLLSKWTCAPPRLIILDEPSRGVDIGARRRIHDFIVEAAAGGAGVLLISSELEEVVALSHRGYLMNEGRIVGEVASQETSVADILFRLFSVARATKLAS